MWGLFKLIPENYVRTPLPCSRLPMSVCAEQAKVLNSSRLDLPPELAPC